VCKKFNKTGRFQSFGNVGLALEIYRVINTIPNAFRKAYTVIFFHEYNRYHGAHGKEVKLLNKINYKIKINK